MNKGNKKGIAVGLLMVAALLIALFFYFTRPKNPVEADTQTPESAETQTADNTNTQTPDDKTGESNPEENNAATESQDTETAPIYVTDSGEIVIEMDEDEETFGE